MIQNELSNETPSEHELVPVPVEDGTEVEPAKAFSLLWLEATDPTLFIPYTLKHGGTAQVSFYSMDDEPSINLYRTVSHYGKGEDAMVEIQDEMFRSGENTGVQFNYELASDGTFVKYPTSKAPSERMQSFVSWIQNLVKKPGARIRGERMFISDGKEWLSEELWKERQQLNPNNDTTLTTKE